MKQTCVLLAVILSIFMLAGCPSPSGSDNADTTIQGPLYKTFWAQKVTDDSWYQVEATRKGSSTHCDVYVANNQSVSEAAAQSVADDFENKTYGLIRSKFGVESDVDGNGKIYILLLDIIDGYSGSGGYVAGYFSPYHCLSGASFPYSNIADMIFMDTYPAVTGDSDFNLTVAHEFQHLVNFNKTYIEGGQKFFDTWINEGLSSAAEYLYKGSQITGKIEYFNADPYWDILFGVYFVKWAPSYADDIYASYSTVYLFFQWLRIHASNGDGIYKDIFSSSSMNYNAVVSAASSRGIGSSWSSILHTWFIANKFNNSTGLYGYKNVISLTPQVLNAGDLGSSFLLAPGEGLYIAFSSSFSPTYQTYIAHSGLTLSTKFVDNDSPYTGDICLVLNTNGNTDGFLKNAYVPVSSAALTEESVSLSRNAPQKSVASYVRPGRWAVDHVFQLPEQQRNFSLLRDPLEDEKKIIMKRMKKLK